MTLPISNKYQKFMNMLILLDQLMRLCMFKKWFCTSAIRTVQSLYNAMFRVHSNDMC